MVAVLRLAEDRSVRRSVAAYMSTLIWHFGNAMLQIMHVCYKICVPVTENMCLLLNMCLSLKMYVIEHVSVTEYMLRLSNMLLLPNMCLLLYICVTAGNNPSPTGRSDPSSTNPCKNIELMQRLLKLKLYSLTNKEKN